MVTATSFPGEEYPHKTSHMLHICYENEFVRVYSTYKKEEDTEKVMITMNSSSYSSQIKDETSETNNSHTKKISPIIPMRNYILKIQSLESGTRQPFLEYLCRSSPLRYFMAQNSYRTKIRIRVKRKKKLQNVTLSSIRLVQRNRRADKQWKLEVLKIFHE